MTNTNRIYSRSFTIPASAIDTNGQVNNVWYVQWMHAESVSPWSTIDHHRKHGIHPSHEGNESKNRITNNAYFRPTS